MSATLPKDISAETKLQTTIAQLEATVEELRLSKEELETTGQELQSTNELLDTTNRELQSTNQTLETANKELQVLNQQLDCMTQELGLRTQEVKGLRDRYPETLKRAPWPVILVGRDEKIQLWNQAAQRLFQVSEAAAIGTALGHVPMQAALRRLLVRRVRGVMEREMATCIRHVKLDFEIALTPVLHERQVGGVLIMFGPGKNKATRPARTAKPKKSSKRFVPTTHRR